MQNYVTRRIGSMMIITLMLIAILFSQAAPSYAATVKTIPSTNTIVAKANKLKLSKENYSLTWNITNHKVKTGKNSEKLLCIPIKSKTASWTVTNFCKIKFTNVGTIDGRQIDCTVNFDSMTVSARKGSSTGETSDGYMGFASIWGIYASTTSGKFSAYFYEGNCGTLMTLYSQYSTNPSVFVNPTKTVNKTAAWVGDTVTYTVKHTMGTFYKTAMSVYGKLEITDVIPENLEYVSAALTNGSGTDITDKGTLTYDESTRTLKFVMGDTWRNIISNYNGQVLKFTVTTKVKEFEGYEALAENKATLSYENNLSVDTNLVTTSLTKPYMVQIVKSIPDSASQLGDGHGKPTFVIKISGNYRRFTFEEEKCKRTDLFAHKNVTFLNYSLIKM